MIHPVFALSPEAVLTCPQRPPVRAGFSLLEVLIAMFILTVGMLGIAAVVVIGNMSAMRALVADRAAAVGRNALAEVRIREMLDPVRWLNVNGSVVVPDRNTPLPVGESFCIDPLYIARINQQINDGQVPPTARDDLARFPYYPMPGVLSMRRVSVNVAFNPAAPPNVQLILAEPRLWERIVVGEDDLVFDANRLSRPRPLYRTDTGSAVPLPRLPGDTPGGKHLLADYQGAYSWMVTVVPQVPGKPSGTQKYLVSAVVFRGRNLQWRDDRTQEAPAERVVTANFLGGGDLRLSVTSSMLGSFAPDDYLNVVEGQYLLLAGQALVRPGVVQTVFLWYRVVATGAIINQGNTYFREVTVAGPDWNPAWCLQVGNDTDGDNVSIETQAVLCTNVYAVYTQVMDGDRLSRLSSLVR